MYLPKALAIKIRDHCLDKLELKLKVPSINRMSLLESEPGGGYYLEIGTRQKKTALPTAEQDYLDKVLVKDGSEKVLAGPDGPLTVRIVTTGDMEFSTGDTWTGDREPVRGGHPISRENRPIGTLGCLVRLRRNRKIDETHTFFLSCRHVLWRPGIPPYLQVLVSDNGNEFPKHVGDLYWSICNEHFDAAIGLTPQIADPIDAILGKGFAWGDIRACQPRPGAAVDGQKVLVCGYKSQKSGTVTDTNTHLWVQVSGEPDHMFKDQIRTDSICEPGDSGAILFASSESSPSLMPIGMAFCNSPSQGDDDKGGTYYNNLEKLFSTVFDEPNLETSLKDESFQLHEIIVETET